jgi:hypothetical protein
LGSSALKTKLADAKTPFGTKLSPVVSLTLSVNAGAGGARSMMKRREPVSEKLMHSVIWREGLGVQQIPFAKSPPKQPHMGRVKSSMEGALVQKVSTDIVKKAGTGEQVLK